MCVSSYVYIVTSYFHFTVAYLAIFLLFFRIYFWAFLPLIERIVERDRKWKAEKGE